MASTAHLFALPDPLHVHLEGEQIVAVDPDTDRHVGRVDLLGGGHVIRDTPEAAVETFDDVARIRQVECNRLLQTDSFGHLTESVAQAADFGFFVAS